MSFYKFQEKNLNLNRDWKSDRPSLNPGSGSHFSLYIRITSGGLSSNFSLEIKIIISQCTNYGFVFSYQSDLKLQFMLVINDITLK